LEDCIALRMFDGRNGAHVRAGYSGIVVFFLLLQRSFTINRTNGISNFSTKTSDGLT
jgi:hypothetical protein